MRIDSREGRSSLTPFILLPSHFSSRPHPSSLRGEWLNFFACGEKDLYAPRLPRRSSSWVGAVRRDEREGEERGKSEHFLFYTRFSPFCLVSHFTKSFGMVWFLNETIKNIELFIILKIENWPIIYDPEWRGGYHVFLSFRR